MLNAPFRRGITVLSTYYDCGDVMYLIVGLGNPGKDYAGSRHNLGFQVVAALSECLKAPRPVQKHWSLYAGAVFKSKQILLAQPLTYMNRSGRAVCELMRNNNIDLLRLLVVYDDLDLPPGKIRLRARGGSGGHRGLQSIIDTLGSEDFARLRIGIGRPPGIMESSDYVLRQIEPADAELFNQAVSTAVDAVILFIDQGLEAAMNIYNRDI